MWLLGILGFLFFGTISYLCRRYLGQHMPASNHHVNLVFYLFFLLPASFLLWAFLPHDVIPSTEVVLLLIVTGLIWPIYYLLTYRASKDIDASVFSIMLDTSTVITALVAFVFLTERLHSPQILGVILLMTSGAVAIWPDLHRRSRSNRKGLLAGTVCVVLLGIGIVLDKVALTEAELGTYFLYSWGLQSLFMVILSFKHIRSFPRFLRSASHRGLVFLNGGSGLLRSLSLTFAILVASSPSVVNAASSLISTTVLIAAYFVLNERRHLRYKIGGASIGFLGLILVSL